MATGWKDFLRRALGWLETPVSVPPFTPSPERVFNVLAEDRIYAVPSDRKRIFNVPAEDRIYTVIE